MKVLFMLPEKGLEEGVKLDHILARVKVFLLNKHDVTLQHADDNIIGRPLDKLWVDEAQDVQG